MLCVCVKLGCVLELWVFYRSTPFAYFDNLQILPGEQLHRGLDTLCGLVTSSGPRTRDSTDGITAPEFFDLYGHQALAWHRFVVTLSLESTSFPYCLVGSGVSSPCFCSSARLTIPTKMITVTHMKLNRKQ